MYGPMNIRYNELFIVFRYSGFKYNVPEDLSGGLDLLHVGLALSKHKIIF